MAQLGLMIPSSSRGAEPNANSVSQLLEAAKNSDTQKKQGIAMALSATRPQTADEVDQLIQTIHGADAVLGPAAINSLSIAQTSDKLPSEKIVGLLDDSSTQVKTVAARLCGQNKLTTAAPKMRSMLKGAASHKIRKYDLGGAKLADMDYVQALSKSLADLGDTESLDIILSRDEVMSIDGFGGPLIAQFGASAMPKIIDLAHQNDYRKGAALQAISHTKDPSAVSSLAALARDPDKQIASAALSSLTELLANKGADKAAILNAMKADLNHKDYFVRGRAVTGLLRSDPQANLPAAMDAVMKDRGVRYEVFLELVRHPQPEAVPYLKKFIEKDGKENPNFTTDRREAAKAIFRATGEKVPYLGIEKDIRLYHDPYLKR
jgi:hypothetical protein